MKVSVSIVAYNHERFIAEAIDSVLMQETDFDYEIIVGDDCSVDRTREIIVDYQRRFSHRIRTVFPAKNLGDGGRPLFVETIRACRGKLIAMMDGDDYWTAPDKLQRQVEYLNAHPECAMCYHNALIIHEDGSQPPTPYNPPSHPAFSATEDLLWSCCVPSCSAMIRKEIVAEFPPWYFAPTWGDLPLYILASERGPIGYIDTIMGVWRIHSGGVWSGLDQVEQLQGFIRLLNNLDRSLKDKYRHTLSQSVAWHNFELARVHADRGNALAANRALLGVVCHAPHELRIHFRDLLRVAIRAFLTSVRVRRML